MTPYGVTNPHWAKIHLVVIENESYHIELTYCGLHEKKTVHAEGYVILNASSLYWCRNGLDTKK